MSKCPRCENNFKKKVLDGVEIEQCVKCGGIFLDQNELQRITADFDSKEKKIISIKNLPDMKIDLQKPVNCIRCQTLMDRVNFRYTSGIFIDYCLNCSSIWLDSGELEKMVNFLKENENISDEESQKYEKLVQKIKDDERNKQDKNLLELPPSGILRHVFNCIYKIAQKVTD